MKLAIIGAGGVRTPVLVEELVRRNHRLHVDQLTMMDIDGSRLDSIGLLAIDAVDRAGTGTRVSLTTDADAALDGADFVITTFRVGGMAARVIDERVPLRYGLVGQETSGAGGFAMALRTVPVLLDYLERMRRRCPDAWLVNFANPSGLLTQAATGPGGWRRSVGICDAPVGLRQMLASLLDVAPQRLFLDYFGLNHLGWVRAVLHDGIDRLSEVLSLLRRSGDARAFGFTHDLLTTLGMIPNEYLYYYYCEREAVERLRGLSAGRAERIAAWNEDLFNELERLRIAGNKVAMRKALEKYLDLRRESYAEAFHPQHDGAAENHMPAKLPEGEGYAGVAFELIEGLSGAGARRMILNVPNAGAISGMGDRDVVEVPTLVDRNLVRPLAAGAVPLAPLELMQRVKAYELLTIEAATTGLFAAAVKALAIHPLVRDDKVARAILRDFCEEHGDAMPPLREG